MDIKRLEPPLEYIKMLEQISECTVTGKAANMAKNDELEAIGLVRQMATQSLSPVDFEDLERCLDTLEKTRHLE